LTGHRKRKAQATVFAALGDETRLALLARLYTGQRRSISDLTTGSKLTRQAITKHLRVLERVRVVHSVRVGRENLFEFNPQPMEEMKAYLECVSELWDRPLARLKALVEGGSEQ
jgi:DNA-binding transcriptional ArsR family regulator